MSNKGQVSVALLEAGTCIRSLTVIFMATINTNTSVHQYIGGKLDSTVFNIDRLLLVKINFYGSVTVGAHLEETTTLLDLHQNSCQQHHAFLK